MAQITLRDYLQETEDAISAGRVDDAFAHCQNILAQFPESLEAQRLLGEAYLSQGRLEEAQQSFDWVLTSDPENVVAYCDRALISERSSDYDTALDCYQQAYELSHGNSHIRQEFNRLSVQAGQQGFMFSRAGLARLYMRGDLLTQAIQEWEAVLAASPGRLDACTGLLETCWREGLYERVEQLANQVLQEVPTCLKALLLLAHVASAKNMQQAQELLKRAAALDPDLLIAQDLFSDSMAKQPAEPFLDLLKRAPASVDTALPQPTQTQTPLQEVASSPAYVPEPPLPSEALATWNAQTNWEGQGAEAPVNFAQGGQPAHDALPMWPADTDPVDDVWSVLEGNQARKEQQALPDFVTQLEEETKNTNGWRVQQDQPAYLPSSPAPLPQEEQPLEAWVPESPLGAYGGDNQEPPEAPAWEASPAYESYKEAPAFGDTDGWGNAQAPVGESGVWTSSVREGAAPPWLNMLTQSEKRQLGDERSMPSSIEEPPPLAQQPTPKEAPKSAPISSSDDDDSFSFGPAWLKSLGAASMDSLVEDFVAPSSSPSPVSVPEEESAPASSLSEPQPAIYEEPISELQEVASYDAWNEQADEVPNGAERNLLTTLEELESDLRSQGFVPLEPNSLSVIAQTQEPASPVAVPQPAAAPHEEVVYQSLPSALAELGSYAQPPSPSASPSTMPAASLPPSPIIPAALPEEPAWLKSLNTVSTSGQASGPQTGQLMQENVQMQTASSPLPIKDVPSYSFEEAPTPEETVVSAPAPVIPQPEETVPTYSSGSFASTGSSAWQVTHNDALLNSELETTMKRPAVRLQPMAQQRPSMQRDTKPSQGKSRAPEQIPARNAAGGGLSAQERLVKGYQHQLVGDYDEAMQEYRIVIRSTPELLAEVVSNVRALLKIAPKYSTGYRILGDAYMRQGEYLQAMEAYNKALTMAKKAKG